MLSTFISILANLFCSLCLFWLGCKFYPKWKTYPWRKAITAWDDNVLFAITYSAAFFGNALYLVFF